jgi:hypothetical protein
MIINFLTFANTSYTFPEHILQQAKEFNIFNKITHKTEHDIPEFIIKHKNFIDTHSVGFGLFIWKPKIILDSLLEMNDGEILLYCDSGIHLNSKGMPRFNEYLSYLEEKPIVSFCCNSRYKPHMYVKQDAVHYYYPEFNLIPDSVPYSYAGAMLIRKCNDTISFIEDWLHLCEIYNFIDGSFSIDFEELDDFEGQDGDNGLFALVKTKFNIHYDITPDEVNIYNDTGLQMEHCKLSTHTNTWDWSVLDKSPIQYRRDR